MHVLEAVASEQWVFTRIVEKSDGTLVIGSGDTKAPPRKVMLSGTPKDTVPFA